MRFSLDKERFPSRRNHGNFHRDRKERPSGRSYATTPSKTSRFALGCGCAWDGKVDLEYVNEHDAADPDLKVLPIFAVPLTVNEEMTTTLDYGFDYAGSLHYGIDVRYHAPFKMNDRIETYVTQEAIWDRGEGRGSLSKQVGKSYSSDGTHLCTVETYDCCIYDGGFGGEPPKDVVDYPDREPDFVYEEVCGLQWPLIYSMMGDWHQQHIDWSYTEQTRSCRPSTTASAARACHAPRY